MNSALLSVVFITWECDFVIKSVCMTAQYEFLVFAINSSMVGIRCDIANESPPTHAQFLSEIISLFFLLITSQKREGKKLALFEL